MKPAVDANSRGVADGKERAAFGKIRRALEARRARRRAVAARVHQRERLGFAVRQEHGRHAGVAEFQQRAGLDVPADALQDHQGALRRAHDAGPRRAIIPRRVLRRRGGLGDRGVRDRADARDVQAARGGVRCSPALLERARAADGGVDAGRARGVRGPVFGAVGEMRGGGEPPRGPSRGRREHRGRAHGARDACHANAERTRGETRCARVVGRRGVCVSVV